MDLRTSTSLTCGALALAIAASIVLRRRPRRAHWFFAAFAADVGLWYLAQWLYHFVRADVWVRFTALLAVLLPQFALHLFDAISPTPRQSASLLRAAGALLLPMLALVLSKWHGHPFARAAIFLYVFGLIAAGLVSLLRRGESSGSRSIQRRVRFLVSCGALAATFSLADFLWFVGAPLPPVGAVLSIVFLFILAESLIRERLVDVYEVLSLALVSTALAFSLAGLFYAFVVRWGAFQDTYLNAVLAGIVMLVLFEPLRDKIRLYIERAFFFERVNLERRLREAQQRLHQVMEVEEMTRITLGALEDSRRVTASAIYLCDESGGDFVLSGFFGPEPPPRLQIVAIAGLLAWLRDEPQANLQELGHGDAHLGRERTGHLLVEADAVGPFRRGVVVAIRSTAGLTLGLLMVHDDRVHDALTGDDVALLRHLGVQLGVVVENSRRYRQMQEQARLAGLGQMAAGLAHEIKNPLGAIKGAAQLLRDPNTPPNIEFVDIILEEVERLDRVVGSVLDYGKPRTSQREFVDINEVVERTLRLVQQDLHGRAAVTLDLGTSLPRVRADAEQLRQVILNLVRNAVEAVAELDQTGRVSIATRHRSVSTELELLEVAVADNGPGVSVDAATQLFTPFFTTKRRGTGLGLAISQRLAQNMQGRIEVHETPGGGATFALLLPVVLDRVSGSSGASPRS